VQSTVTLPNHTAPTTSAQPVTALVFAGGLGLAAYHGGAYQAFVERSLPLHCVVGSSAGAITAALIAGNAPSDRIPRLREFWNLQFSSSQLHPFSASRRLAERHRGGCRRRSGLLPSQYSDLTAVS
jgi:predicted acylesterase/phospholipase RssA